MQLHVVVHLDDAEFRDGKPYVVSVLTKSGRHNLITGRGADFQSAIVAGLANAANPEWSHLVEVQQAAIILQSLQACCHNFFPSKGTA